MKRTKQLIIVMLLILLAQALVACSDTSTRAAEKDVPGYAEAVEGSEFNLVVVTERATERLDIQTGLVRQEQINGASRLVVPYATLIYGLNGETWVYVSPEPLTYMRAPVTVDYIEGDTAVLLNGPPVDTVVATVGVAELYGIDTGVGK